MANLSDWLGALAQPVGAAPGPGWLALLGEDGAPAFRADLPFGGHLHEALPPPLPLAEPEPEAPTADPLAQPVALAFAQGEAAGRAAAAAEAEDRVARQRALRLAFRPLDEAAQAVLADDLVATVLTLCNGVLGEAALDRSGLLARCHAAARRIGGAAEALTLHLHPDDVAVLGDDALAGWAVMPDPALERGTVLIEGADGSVSDGPAEWRRAIAAAVRG